MISRPPKSVQRLCICRRPRRVFVRGDGGLLRVSDIPGFGDTTLNSSESRMVSPEPKTEPYIDRVAPDFNAGSGLKLRGGRVKTHRQGFLLASTLGLA
jgi:hypothetical protein